MTLRSLLTDLRLQGAQNPHPTLRLPEQGDVAAHFHLTEIGLESRDFIDCGGTRRQRRRALLQLLVADDFDHRLEAEKFARILEGGCRALDGLEEAEVEIELQGRQSVERYELAKVRFGLVLELQARATSCLAPDTCGLEEPDGEIVSHPAVSGCAPGSGCC